MSPPCQPFTSGGKRLDHQDVRSAGLLHIIKNILPNLKYPPKYIFLENVPNFEVSTCRDLLLECLLALGYKIDEFLISPIDLGIPNDRKRYYLAASLADKDENGNSNLKPYPLDDLSLIHRHPSSFNKRIPKSVPLKPLADYMDASIDMQADENQNLWVKEKDILKRNNFIFDCVQPASAKTSTFTKAYGSHHFFGSGSFLQTCFEPGLYHSLQNEKDNDWNDTKQVVENNSSEFLVKCKPRFFSPYEVAKLHDFPVDFDPQRDGMDGIQVYGFSFPEGITNKQKWMLLGNSLNVAVVSCLLDELLFPQTLTPQQSNK